MGNIFRSNDFKTNYRKRPRDEYNKLYSQLDDETRKKFARQRSLVLIGVVVLVFIFIIVLAVTGLGTNKSESIGNILGGTETVKINCLGDQITTGSGSASYPQAMKSALEEQLEASVETRIYAVEEGIAKNTSYKIMDEKGDIVIILCTLENFRSGTDPEGILEANIDGIANQGCLVYLADYPYASFSEDAAYAGQANEYIAQAAKDKGITLLDAATYFRKLVDQGRDETELFAEDGISLTDEGCNILGQFIAGGLLQDAGLD